MNHLQWRSRARQRSFELSKNALEIDFSAIRDSTVTIPGSYLIYLVSHYKIRCEKRVPLRDKGKRRSQKLYPNLTKKQNKEALENLHRYFELGAEIMEDLESRGKLDDVVGEMHLRSEWESVLNPMNRVSQNVDLPNRGIVKPFSSNSPLGL